MPPTDAQGPAEAPQCPVCQARFRRQRSCPRCGADLTALMRLGGQAWLARQAARAAIRAGDLDSAGRLAHRAQQLCHTPAGQSLLTFTAATQRVLAALGTIARVKDQAD